MLSVEGGKTAVKNAQRNLRALNLPDVDARCGDVSATLAHVPAHLSRPDLVVLDPPRAGAHAKVCRQIAQAGAKDVIYVACDPTSLARDTATLISLGLPPVGHPGVRHLPDDPPRGDGGLVHTHRTVRRWSGTRRS